MSMSQACQENLSVELDRRFKDHDRRHTDKLAKCRNDVETNLERVVEALQRMEAMHADTAADVKQMKEKMDNLIDFIPVWTNYKGAKAVIGWLFGPQALKYYMVLGAFFYALVHNWQWPNWLRGE